MRPHPSSTLCPYTTLFRSLCSQIQRAAVSAMTNIAEGFDGESKMEFGRFPGIARRSAVEVQSPLYVALDTKYIDRNCFGDRKSTRLNSSHPSISYAVFCLK